MQTFSGCGERASHSHVWAPPVVEHGFTGSVVAGCGLLLLALRHVGSQLPTRDQTCIRFIGRWSLNHWTTREVPVCLELSSGDSNTPSRKRTTVQNAVCMCVKSLQSCLTLCNPMDCSLPGPSVHESLQARILEWVAVPSSRESSHPRDLTCVSSICCIGRLVLYHWPFLGSPKMHHGRPLGNLVLYLRSRL